MPAGWGTQHVGAGTCRRHLGNTVTRMTHAVAVLAERADEKAMGELRRLGHATPADEPLMVLAQCAGEARQYLDILRDAMTAEPAMVSTLAYERNADRLV